MTVVKICGVRTLEDALAAVDAGADMLGFNFYPPSPRYIDPAACAGLVARMSAARVRLPKLAGVFVNEPPDTISRILRTCSLDYAQLSGDESPEDLLRLDGRAFKAIRPRDVAGALDLARRYGRAAPPAVLLDASATGLYGGSGAVADWSVAAALAAEMPLMLAGGLTPENVAEAVRAVAPWGVDVASGVESAPGVKDPRKMELFVRRTRETAAN
jgi:phosphoribosylanthranilate isomerase